MGLSLGKLLVLAALIAAVWLAFKHKNRIAAVRSTLERERTARRERARPAPSKLAAEDLARCERCGSYVAAHSSSACGRADCPWGTKG